MTTTCQKSSFPIDEMINSSSLLLGYVYEKFDEKLSNIKSKPFKKSEISSNSINLNIKNHHDESVETFQKYEKNTEPVLIDLIIPIEPKKKFKTKIRVKSVKRGELDFSEPEIFVDPEDY